MFYQYMKFPITKDLRNAKRPLCIVISQNTIDGCTADIIIRKRVKIVINCADYVMETEALKILRDKGIKMYFLNETAFNNFKGFGLTFVTESAIYIDGGVFDTIEPSLLKLDNYIYDFIKNTVDHMNNEKELIDSVTLKGDCIKPSKTALIVSRSLFNKNDFKTAKNIIKNYSPTIICVDGGADICLTHGIKPDLVIGDMDSITDFGINRCDNFILHTYLNKSCPGMDRIPCYKNKGYISCFGTSEDAAILYCVKNGVNKIFILGFKTNARDYIEKGRKGMASSILIRICYGHIIYEVESIEFNSYRRTEYIAIVILGSLIYTLLIMGLTFEVFK